jgi:biopolymer transport protein ExbB/TolQ
MTFTCPSCQMQLQSEPSMAGQIAHCPGCGGKIQIPSGLPQATGAGLGLGAEHKRGGWPETDPANVPVLLALGLGMGAMAIVVGIFWLIRNTFVGQVFWTGGWVNYLEFFLFFWGLGILYLKWQKTKHQRDALLLDVLPKSVGVDINAANVGNFIDNLYRLPERSRDSMMVNRIRKSLELFEVRNNNGEVASALEGQSAIDANRVAGSYALLKVFLWAIPILGFIGTVLGLSFAMAAFGTVDLTDMEALKTSVGAITTGLATAFNTTLLGLILSMFLIFPMSTMQTTEEDCLNEIDAFCNEKLLPLLNDGGASGGKMSELVQNPASFAQLLTEFATGQQQLVTDLRAVTQVVQEAAGGLEARALQHQQAVEAQFGDALKEMMNQTADSVTASSKTVEEYVSTLATGIDGLNKALTTLGEKQIRIREAPKSRGLFGRRK